MTINNTAFSGWIAAIITWNTLNIKPAGDNIYNILKVIIGRGLVRISSLIAINKKILAKIN